MQKWFWQWPPTLEAKEPAKMNPANAILSPTLTNTGYSFWTCEKARQRALKLARGCYQRAIVEGHHNLSGSSLRGTAKHYGGRYARSRANLLKRLQQDENLEAREVIGAHGKRILEIYWVN